MSGPQAETPCRDEILSAMDWQERARAHRERAREWTQPMRDRRARGEKHPVFDFLNTYYQVSLGRLERWEPELGLRLEDCQEARGVFSEKCYQFTGGVCGLAPNLMARKERERLGFTLQLLVATQERSPNFACHGLHEWAMVYGGVMVRHRETVPLRLSQDAIDTLVESRPLCCSHFDAFRFFAPDAQPLNRLQPDLWSREEHEQPGCIHANMDLYKWSAKSMPWVGSALLWDCFLLAIEAREIDMRASPYDLSEFAYEPIPVETAEGREAYEIAQRGIHEKARALRGRLITSLQNVLAAAEDPDHSPADAEGFPSP